ncbi:hypothetical protein AALB16_14335 [Lachnospiraceae bacterium 62-35]
MKLKKMIFMLGCAMLLCGCTDSNMVTPEGTAAPDMIIRENVQLDWNQIRDDLNDDYVGTSDYPFGVEIDINADDSNAYVMVTVKDDTTREDALRYATQLIRGCNDAVASQDLGYTASTNDYYGGYAETHNIWIQVMPESTKDDEDTWLVDDVIMAGDQEPVSEDGWLSKMNTSDLEKKNPSEEE